MLQVWEYTENEQHKLAQYFFVWCSTLHHYDTFCAEAGAGLIKGWYDSYAGEYGSWKLNRKVKGDINAAAGLEYCNLYLIKSCVSYIYPIFVDPL